ncbi:MAG: RNA polymerase sigma factor [Planctomycetota bacterium]
MSFTDAPANNDDPDPLTWSDDEVADQQDKLLVQAALGGDAEAFGQLFERYRERIFRVLCGVVRHREDALEATQDVFVKIYRALPRFDPAGRFFTWAYRIAVNQGIDRLRSRKTRKEHSLDGVDRLDPTEPLHGRAPLGPPAELERREVMERLEAALAGLSSDQRTVFLLYSFEGLSYSEIAEVTEVPIGTVMSRLFYARRKLREELPAEWDPGGREAR